MPNIIKNDIVDWKDPALVRWLGTFTNKGTAYSCRAVYRGYAQYTGKTASQLIDEAIEDFKRDPRERQDIVLKQLVGFYQWLRKDYVRKKTVGKNGKTVDSGKGTSGRSAIMRVNVIRSFYATYDITVRMKGKNKLPKAKIENKRIVFKPEDVWKVKVLVDNARTLRDRAIVLCHFQGGMDVATLCSLNYEEVAEGLAKNEEPLKIEVARVKTGVEFYTFIGKDAIEALKAYLADMRSRGVKFDNKTPLFLQEKGKERIRTHNIQTMLKDLVVRSGFVTEENNGNSFNPLGTHSLRESFGSLMINSGVPDTIVDFWLGHEIGEMAEAYKTVQFQSLRKMYMEREHLISISNPKADDKKLVEIKNAMDQLEKENAAFKTRIDGLQKQTQEMDAQLTNINSVIDFIRIEDTIRFVSTKCPTQEEMLDYLKRRQVDPAILRRPELSCLTYSRETKRWHYLPDMDTYKIGD
ncbi:MAG: tyrosine-type recombinase/integrase [Candidatus Bathyarchaeia archaeon]|jgi:integrase/recombinase XerD